MDTDILIGCIVLVCALAALIGLTFWSRRTINWIARNHVASAREILKHRNER